MSGDEHAALYRGLILRRMNVSFTRYKSRKLTIIFSLEMVSTYMGHYVNSVSSLHQLSVSVFSTSHHFSLLYQLSLYLPSLFRYIQRGWCITILTVSHSGALSTFLTQLSHHKVHEDLLSPSLDLIHEVCSPVQSRSDPTSVWLTSQKSRIMVFAKSKPYSTFL